MIKAEIFDQKIKLNVESVASNSVNFLKIQFLLDEVWDSAVKTAVFKNEEMDISAAVILEEGNELYLGGNTCLVPFEVIKPPCFSVSLSGVKGDTVITTIPEEIKVYKSGDISADDPQGYTPSQYEQMISICNETKGIAQSVRDDADNGVFDGKDGVSEQSYNPESTNAQSGKAVAEAIKGLDGVFASAIKPTLTGNIIAANDVSPIEHELKVGIKNYFVLKNVKTGDNGVTVNNDNTLTVVPTNPFRIILGKLTDICPELKGGEGIVLSYSDINEYNAMGLKYTDNTNTGASEDIMSTSPNGDTNNMITSGMLPEDISNVYIYYACDNTTHTVSNIIVRTGEPVDLTSISVSRYGKNVFDATDAPMYNTYTQSMNQYSWEETNTGFKVAFKRAYPNGTSLTHGYCIGKTEDLRGKTITISFDFNTTSKAISLIYVCGYSKESGYSGNSADQKEQIKMSPNGAKSVTFTVGDNITLPYVAVWAYIGYNGEVNVGDTTEYSNFQVEFNDHATEYSPYIHPQTVSVNADGTVKGLTSLSPNMTLMANNPTVTLECEYNADTKMYIDNKLKALI